MTQLYLMSSHQSQQLALLRKYLSQNKVSKRLAMRCTRNATHALQENQRYMSEDSVVLLAMVSEPLRVELHFELYQVELAVHPFFRRYVEECPQVTSKVCHMAMSYALISCGDVIFSIGESLLRPKMYFVGGRGDLAYTACNGRVSELSAGNWISEATLWTTWVHRGTLTAAADGRICCLDAKQFQDTAGQFEHIDFDPALYAHDFLERLNDLGDEASDLQMPTDEAEAFSEAFASQALGVCDDPTVSRGSAQSRRGRKSFAESLTQARKTHFG